jgi:vancomycin aglycone glucosyltransferase
MRTLLSTYGSRGDVEPMVGLAVQLGALGAEVRVCAPPDFAELLAGVGVPLVPIGQPVRPPVTKATTPAADSRAWPSCRRPVRHRRRGGRGM